MEMSPICLSDSQLYSLYMFPQIAEYLKNYPDICVVYNHTFQFKFTGVLIINNLPVIVFPKNYKIQESLQIQIEEASILTRTLIRYRNEPVHEIEENRYLFGDSANCNARITTAIRIIEDYKMYGYLHRNLETFSTTRKGKVEWAKTINKTIPSINHGRVAYSNPVMKSSRDDSRNTICRIHRYIVSDAVQIWGWLTGMHIDYEMSEATMPCPAEDGIFVLQQELRNVYVQREIGLIKMMIAYLRAKAGVEQNFNKEILGTQYFSFVWEAICGYMFYNKYPVLNSLVPQPEWESDIVEGRISQRPDVFTVHKDVLYILDAKYYNFNSNLPGWHDVVKQMFYRHTVMLNLKTPHGRRMLPKSTEVKNAFLFPGSEKTSLQYVGKVFVKGIDDLGEVKAFAVNQRDAMRIYAYRNDDVYRNEIVNQLATQC
ncbi:LlaJI restriction endonuclease [Kineothrix alysoides]|uniref:LlaJI restriction endonuclease n=1 Tax=Kineothrix alysoides TaxID=1469948 RepID=A0A4R1R4V5_9FIRM|nr:LlaJI family restriction endonuclease [Kineothrix alysoides]TCL60535.1 LlaJI restriction endonuclease [Kineothrix alysoides]